MTKTIPTLSYEQNQAFAAFLEQSGLTERSLYYALERAKREEGSAEIIANRKEKEDKYGGKFYAVENGENVIYYKVIAPYGFTCDQISCIWFGSNPMLEKSYDYCGEVNEILLTEDTDFFSGSVDVREFIEGREISAEEFATAFREWTERVLKLEWKI